MARFVCGLKFQDGTTGKIAARIRVVFRYRVKLVSGLEEPAQTDFISGPLQAGRSVGMRGGCFSTRRNSQVSTNRQPSVGRKFLRQTRLPVASLE